MKQLLRLQNNFPCYMQLHFPIPGKHFFSFPDEIVCQYFGTLIDAEDVPAAEQEHEQLGFPSAMLFINARVYLNPYRVRGFVRRPTENPGTWLNHSRFRFNCKLASVKEGGERLGVVVLAVKDISEGDELLLDYGRMGGDEPDFLYN